MRTRRTQITQRYTPGDVVYMTDDAAANYSSRTPTSPSYRGLPLVVTAVSAKHMPHAEFFARGQPYGYHPGFDDACGCALYDLMEQNSLRPVTLSLYDYELK